MKRTIFARRTFLGAACWAGAIGLSAWCGAEEPRSREQLQEPVFREAKVADQKRESQHPLDPALKIAYDGLEHLKKDVKDYTATLVKRERINGTLSDQEFMFTKIRSRKIENGTLVQPLSIYLKFLKPKALEGRESIWVEGMNNGKMVAHNNPGPLNLARYHFLPEGFIPMRGNRYPITEMGIENLVEKLVEKGERDRKRDECEVQFFKGAKINGRVCTLLQVTHLVKREYFDFHVAQIFIDDELNAPLRYAAYTWPNAAGGKPVLEEEYTYMDLKLNVGLTDMDFNPDNPEYKYPR